MIKEAMQYLVGLSDKPQEFKVSGRTYVHTHRQGLERITEDKFSHVKLNTLDGIINFALDLKEKSKQDLSFIITGTKEVVLQSTDFNTDRNKIIFATADCGIFANNITTHSRLDSERFIITMLSKFKKNEMAETLMAVANSVTREDETGISDDGVSVKATQGRAIKKKIEINNPVYLQPIVSFPEITQPTVPYIFRISEDLEYSLHVGDDSLANLDCISKISEYINNSLKNTNLAGSLILS